MIDVVGTHRPDWCGVCRQCQHGVISVPALHQTSVPLNIAYAIAMDLGYVLFCDCRSGRNRLAHAEDTLRHLKQLRTTTVLPVEHNTFVWGKDAPIDYIPGSWWMAVKEVCEATDGVGV